jgi:hypothetical protein
MESFGALSGNKRDSILLQALQHTGGQFRAMQEELENLCRENCLLRCDKDRGVSIERYVIQIRLCSSSRGESTVK